MKETMTEEHLVVGRKTAKSGTWTIGARLASRVIDLATMLVLAHVLHPRDFGLVAIAMTVIFIVEAALELPVSQALVRLPVIEPSHYDTAFTLSLLRGLALSTIVCLVAWPFAHYYTDARLLPLVCVLSLAPAARGLVSPRLADFSKRLDFSPDFRMEFLGKLFAFVLAVVLAIVTRSYWAIAVGTIAAPIASTITSYILAPYRPRLSLAQMPAFSGFLGWITAAQVVGALNWQADRLLLGKLTSKSELGLFTTANDTANIPIAALFGPLLRPLLSAFSLLREDPARLAASYQNSACAMVTIGLPILIGESLLADAAVRLMFGPNWAGSAPLLRWLAVSLIPTLFAIPLGPLVMAFGKTQIFLRRNLFEISIKLPLVVIGAIQYHFMGVVIARCISETATVCYCMIVVRSLIGLSIREQLIGPWRSVVSVGAMAGVILLVRPLLTSAPVGFALALGTIATVALGAVVYFGVLWLLWRAAGEPGGLESMIMGKVSDLLKRQSRSEAPSLL